MEMLLSLRRSDVSKVPSVRGEGTPRPERSASESPSAELQMGEELLLAHLGQPIRGVTGCHARRRAAGPATFVHRSVWFAAAGRHRPPRPTVLYLIFNEGYLATDPEKEAVPNDLTAEAIRLTRLVRALMPADGEVAGLLALMLMTEARRAARVSASGELVTLDEQDRGAWDRELIAEGHALVPRPPRRRPGAGALPDPRCDQRRPHRRPRRP
jgi:hypothetical protein